MQEKLENYFSSYSVKNQITVFPHVVSLATILFEFGNCPPPLLRPLL